MRLEAQHIERTGEFDVCRAPVIDGAGQLGTLPITLNQCRDVDRETEPLLDVVDRQRGAGLGILAAGPARDEIDQRRGDLRHTVAGRGMARDEGVEHRRPRVAIEFGHIEDHRRDGKLLVEDEDLFGTGLVANARRTVLVVLDCGQGAIGRERTALRIEQHDFRRHGNPPTRPTRAPAQFPKPDPQEDHLSQEESE